MARRRYQQPKPFQEGQFWWLRVWDMSPTGSRKRQRIKLAPVNMPAREVQKIAEEKLRPVNTGLALTGSAMSLNDFVTSTYIPTYLPLLSSSTQASYNGMIAKYLEPRFGRLCLRDLTRLTLQQYFSAMAGQTSYPVISKIRDALSSIHPLRGRCDYLSKNPIEGLRLPLDKRPRQSKPTITPQDFNKLVQLVVRTLRNDALRCRVDRAPSQRIDWPEVAMYSCRQHFRGRKILPGGLVRSQNCSECGNDRRFARSDQSHPSPENSHRRSSGGTRTRKYKLVKSDGPDDLVFQSVQTGQPDERSKCAQAPHSAGRPRNSGCRS